MNNDKYNELISKIEYIEDNPCGRNIQYYGASKTERSILELCSIVKEVINMVHSMDQSTS